MSDYFNAVKKHIKGKLPISKSSESELYIYNEKNQSSLCISPYRVTYKGYVVPLNESEVEDLYTLASMAYSVQEEKSKKEALDELKGE